MRSGRFGPILLNHGIGIALLPELPSVRCLIDYLMIHLPARIQETQIQRRR